MASQPTLPNDITVNTVGDEILAAAAESRRRKNRKAPTSLDEIGDGCILSLNNMGPENASFNIFYGKRSLEGIMLGAAIEIVDSPTINSWMDEGTKAIDKLISSKSIFKRLCGLGIRLGVSILTGIEI